MSAGGFNESFLDGGFTNQTGEELVEFPLWAPIVAIDLILYLGILAPSSIFFNITVFVALIKSKIKQKPMLVLYGSLLLSLCVDKLLIFLFQVVTIESTIRYCICMQPVLVFGVILRAFFGTYSIVIITCQSVLQLLTIANGKEKMGI